MFDDKPTTDLMSGTVVARDGRVPMPGTVLTRAYKGAVAGG